MKPYLPFREYHLFQLLEIFDSHTLPLDLTMSNYFRTHKALGPKDRAFIAESIYGMVRWLSLLDYLCGKTNSWDARFQAFRDFDYRKTLKDESIPLSIRVSFPESLLNLLINSYGKDKSVEFCLASNTSAPTTLRANVLKRNREALISQWKDQYHISACEKSPYGIIFHKKINFFSLPEFEKGLFEIQDEASQLVAALVEAKPGQQVLDYCSGSGGKTLAFAPLMDNKGQIFLHDIRPQILHEAKRRLRRAGIQNAQIVQPNSPTLEKLKKRMDWVMVDAPCTGTGTLRRNPDMKWKFDPENMKRLQGEQRKIFERALSFMRPGGKIVYATCSVLNEENQMQVEHFIKTYQLELDKPLFKSLTSEGGMDGFFAAVLRKKCT